MDRATRQAHASLNVASRLRKAEKIYRLIRTFKAVSAIERVLEVGAGSGVISYHLSKSLGSRVVVDAVDVKDQRILKEGYKFQTVTGTDLPFDTGVFDLVISNHVIEHVGKKEDQIHHLQEMRRVLRSTGIGYLAVPSRWQIVEPHYGLLFLSWLPRGWRTPYLRALRGVGAYDCEPLSLHVLDSYFRLANCGSRKIFSQAVKAAFDSERASRGLKLLARVPDDYLNRLACLSPTHVCLFAHSQDVLRGGGPP